MSPSASKARARLKRRARARLRRPALSESASPSQTPSASPSPTPSASPSPSPECNQFFTLEAAPAAPLSRYDLLVAGIDGNIDVVKGTAAATPVMPSVPADHIKIAHVLVLGGATEIRDQDINALWEARRLTSVEWSLSSRTGTINGDGEFEWHLTNDTPECNVTVTFKCQYGWNFTVSDTLTFTKQLGIGQVFSGDSGYDSDEVTQWVNYYKYSFRYERDQAGSEISPVFLSLTFENNILHSGAQIVLLDVAGDPIE